MSTTRSRSRSGSHKTGVTPGAPTAQYRATPQNDFEVVQRLCANYVTNSRNGVLPLDFINWCANRITTAAQRPSGTTQKPSGTGQTVQQKAMAAGQGGNIAA